MKAVIVELKGSMAAALTQDGGVTAIPNQAYQIGQTIDIGATARPGKKLLRWVACAAAAVALCATTVWAYYTPYSYVSVDVNPSVEYSVNIFNRVLKVSAVNDDGEVILKEVELRHQNIEDAVSKVIEQIKKDGYLNKENTNAIMISTSCENEQKAQRLSSLLEARIAEETKDTQTEVESISVAPQRVEEARKLGVTPGKLNLVRLLQESAKHPEDISVDEWINRPVKEIMHARKELRKQAHLEQKQAREQEKEQRKKDKEGQDGSSSSSQSGSSSQSSSSAQSGNASKPEKGKPGKAPKEEKKPEQPGSHKGGEAGNNGNNGNHKSEKPDTSNGKLKNSDK